MCWQLSAILPLLVFSDLSFDAKIKDKKPDDTKSDCCQ